MRVEIWHWYESCVAGILPWDPMTEEPRSRRAQKRLKRDVAEAFQERVEDAAMDRFEAQGGVYTDEDDPLADVDYAVLIGEHFRVRLYPYWFTGLVTGLRPAYRRGDGEGLMGLVDETVMVEMVSPWASTPSALRRSTPLTPREAPRPAPQPLRPATRPCAQRSCAPLCGAFSCAPRACAPRQVKE